MKNHKRKLQRMFTFCTGEMQLHTVGFVSQKVVLLNDNMLDNLHYSLESYLGLTH